MKIAKNRKGHLSTKWRQRTPKPASRAASVEIERNKKRKIAGEVRQYLEEKQISRLQFENMVKRSQSTINHFFAGDFSPTLLRRIERLLNRDFGETSSVAPVEWGEYTQDSTAKVAGSYLTLRYDFENTSQICAYTTTIEWGKIDQAHIFDGRLVQKPKIDGYGLVFREERRVDTKYTHRGQIWFPGGQFLYLVTAYGDGRLRAAIASLPDDGKMTGIQLSLYNPRGSGFIPAVSPIAFLRREKISDAELGNIQSGHAFYKDYKRILDEAMEDVVFALPSAVISQA